MMMIPYRKGRAMKSAPGSEGAEVKDEGIMAVSCICEAVVCGMACFG